MFPQVPSIKKAWYAGHCHLETNKDVAFVDMCSDVSQCVKNKNMSLSTSSALVLGAARIYSTELDDLFDDIVKLDKALMIRKRNILNEDESINSGTIVNSSSMQLTGSTSPPKTSSQPTSPCLPQTQSGSQTQPGSQTQTGSSSLPKSSSQLESTSELVSSSQSNCSSPGISESASTRHVSTSPSKSTPRSKSTAELETESSQSDSTSKSDITQQSDSSDNDDSLEQMRQLESSSSDSDVEETTSNDTTKTQIAMERDAMSPFQFHSLSTIPEELSSFMKKNDNTVHNLVDDNISHNNLNTNRPRCIVRDYNSSTAAQNISQSLESQNTLTAHESVTSLLTTTTKNKVLEAKMNKEGFYRAREEYSDNSDDEDINKNSKSDHSPILTTSKSLKIVQKKKQTNENKDADTAIQSNEIESRRNVLLGAETFYNTTDCDTRNCLIGSNFLERELHVRSNITYRTQNKRYQCPKSVSDQSNPSQSKQHLDSGTVSKTNEEITETHPHPSQSEHNCNVSESRQITFTADSIFGSVSLYGQCQCDQRIPCVIIYSSVDL